MVIGSAIESYTVPDTFVWPRGLLYEPGKVLGIWKTRPGHHRLDLYIGGWPLSKNVVVFGASRLVQPLLWLSGLPVR